MDAMVSEVLDPILHSFKPQVEHFKAAFGWCWVGWHKDFIGSEFNWEAVTDREGKDFWDRDKTRDFIGVADDKFDAIRSSGFGFDSFGWRWSFFFERLRSGRCHLEMVDNGRRRGDTQCQSS